MSRLSMLSRVSRSTANPDRIARDVIRKPSRVTEMIAALTSPKARTRYGCLKVLRIVSEQDPAIVYRHIAAFIALLGSENSILHWGAIAILGNLASVDDKARIDEILPQFLRPIRGPVMITAANTIIAAAVIAAAKPHLMPTIVNAIISVERASYQTEECRNIAIGHAITALDGIYDRLSAKGRVIEFVTGQLHNGRHATRKKAAAFLARHAVAMVIGRG